MCECASVSEQVTKGKEGRTGGLGREVITNCALYRFYASLKSNNNEKNSFKFSLCINLLKHTHTHMLDKCDVKMQFQSYVEIECGRDPIKLKNEFVVTHTVDFIKYIHTHTHTFYIPETAYNLITTQCNHLNMYTQ